MADARARLLLQAEPVRLELLLVLPLALSLFAGCVLALAGGGLVDGRELLPLAGCLPRLVPGCESEWLELRRLLVGARLLSLDLLEYLLVILDQLLLELLLPELRLGKPLLLHVCKLFLLYLTLQQPVLVIPAGRLITVHGKLLPVLDSLLLLFSQLQSSITERIFGVHAALRLNVLHRIRVAIRLVPGP